MRLTSHDRRPQALRSSLSAKWVHSRDRKSPKKLDVAPAHQAWYTQTRISWMSEPCPLRQRVVLSRSVGFTEDGGRITCEPTYAPPCPGPSFQARSKVFISTSQNKACLAKKLLSLTVFCSSIDGCITWVNTTNITNQYNKWCYSSMNNSGKSVILWNGWNTHIRKHYWPMTQTTTKTHGFLPSTYGGLRNSWTSHCFSRGWISLAVYQSLSLCLTAMNHHYQPSSTNIKQYYITMMNHNQTISTNVN